jgi:hypothetical protein
VVDAIDADTVEAGAVVVTAVVSLAALILSVLAYRKGDTAGASAAEALGRIADIEERRDVPRPARVTLTSSQPDPRGRAFVAIRNGGPGPITITGAELIEGAIEAVGGWLNESDAIELDEDAWHRMNVVILRVQGEQLKAPRVTVRWSDALGSYEKTLIAASH